MIYEIKQSTAYTAPEVVTTISELTAAAFATALDAIHSHRADEYIFETDADFPGFADAVSSNYQLYTIEPVTA